MSKTDALEWFQTEMYVDFSKKKIVCEKNFKQVLEAFRIFKKRFKCIEIRDADIQQRTHFFAGSVIFL